MQKSVNVKPRPPKSPALPRPVTVDEALILQRLLAGAGDSRAFTWWPACYGTAGKGSSSVIVRKV